MRVPEDTVTELSKERGDGKLIQICKFKKVGYK
jgi:hypothetical protein